MDNQRREFILRRDNSRCQFCGSQENLHVHHIQPRGEGGTDHPHNLVTACASCHQKQETRSEKFQRKALLESGLVDGTLEGATDSEGNAYIPEVEATGIITDGQREILRNAESVGSETRHEIEQTIERRMQRIWDDCLLIADIDESDIEARFSDRFDDPPSIITRLERLENEVEELREQVEEDE